MEAEFAALGAPFHERGRRMDEGIALMRAVWTDDPITFPTRWIPAVVQEMRMQPRPVAPIPIWIGGSSEPALKRAMGLDGWHGSRVTPDAAPALVRRLRATRPDPAFTISLRLRWDSGQQGRVRADLAAYAEAGVQHVLLEPMEREVDAWLRAVEDAAGLITRAA
jgi:hypothetical protein